MATADKHKRRSGYSYIKDSYAFQYGQAVTGRYASLDAMKKRQRKAALDGKTA